MEKRTARRPSFALSREPADAGRPTISVLEVRGQVVLAAIVVDGTRLGLDVAVVLQDRPVQVLRIEAEGQMVAHLVAQRGGHHTDTALVVVGATVATQVVVAAV